MSNKTEALRLASNQNKGWTEEDDLFIIGNHGKMSGKEIAAHLNRTTASVYGRIYAINKGTNKTKPSEISNSNKFWSWEDDQKILELNYNGRSVESIAKVLKRTAVSITGRIQSLKKLGKKYKPSEVKPNLTPIDEYKAAHPDYKDLVNDLVKEYVKVIDSPTNNKLDIQAILAQFIGKKGTTIIIHQE